MRVLSTTALAVLITACSGGTDRTVTDVGPLSSVGGGLRDSTALACEAVTEPSDGFGRIGLIAPGTGGRLAWADPVVGQVILRDADDSEHVAGRDPGTGHFSLTGALGWAGDTLWVSDAELGQVQYLSGAGRLLKVDTLPPLAKLWLPRGGGRYLGFASRINQADAWVVVAARPGAVPDTLATFPVPASRDLRLPTLDGNDTLTIADPLSPRTQVARSDDGGRWCAAIPGQSDRVRLLCTDDRGKATLDTLLKLQPRPVSGAIYDSIMAELVTRRGADLMSVLQVLSPESTLPLVNGLRVDVSGDLWLQLSAISELPVEWLRVRRDGAVRDTLIIPSQLTPRGLRGDTIWVADSTGLYRQPTVLRCIFK